MRSTIDDPNRSRSGVQFQDAQLHAAVGEYGFTQVHENQIDEFHQLADELIEGEVAGPEALWRVQSWTGRALQLRRKNDKANALLASIPLTQAGVDALLAGEFGFANARREWVCGPTETAHALLSWGMAGRSPMDQAASLRGLLAVWYGVYCDIRVYARARSVEGEKLMSRLGFVPLGRPDGVTMLFGSTGFPHRIAEKLSVRSKPISQEQFA
ncbi:hypothetical protein [Maricaulis sp.]|uniref:hypothetical protein n=1 Tax=Maricaulis sp. TaxID=1486257 RepID=UPI003A95DE00